MFKAAVANSLTPSGSKENLLQPDERPKFPQLSPETKQMVYGSDSRSSLKPFVQELFDYQNIARIKPAFIVSILEQKFLRESAKSASPYSKSILEALEELREMPPLPPLKYSEEISLECDKKLSARIAQENETKADDNMKKTVKFDGYGFYPGDADEIVYYGKDRPSDIILKLIIDERFGKEQRQKLYSSTFGAAGIALRQESGDNTSKAIFSYI